MQVTCSQQTCSHIHSDVSDGNRQQTQPKGSWQVALLLGELELNQACDIMCCYYTWWGVYVSRRGVWGWGWARGKQRYVGGGKHRTATGQMSTITGATTQRRGDSFNARPFTLGGAHPTKHTCIPETTPKGVAVSPLRCPGLLASSCTKLAVALVVIVKHKSVHQSKPRWQDPLST